MAIDTSLRIVATHVSRASASTAHAAASEDTSLLPACRELRASGDLGAMISAMLLEAAHDQRSVARQAREAAMKSEEAIEQSKLDDMRSAAESRFHAGLFGGVATVGSGVATAGGGLAQRDSPAKAALDGGAKGAAGGGQVTSAFFKRDADASDADAARDTFAASQAKHRVDSAINDAKDARDLASKAMELYKEFATAKSDSQKAAIQRA